MAQKMQGLSPTERRGEEGTVYTIILFCQCHLVY